MAAYERLAQEARLKVLQIVHRAQTSHIASNFSVIDIATVLYENISSDDVVVWSKGWAAASVYYFLAKQGKISYEDLDKFPNPPFLGLAETDVPGVLCNGGAVGHGTPIAVGMAYAKMLKGETGTVYCIMSDGELNEGTVWESIIFAAHHKLNNLVFLIDNNGWQAMGRTEDVLYIDAQRAFEGHGALVMTIDGHNYQEIESALQEREFNYDKPRVIICDTAKGKGVSFFEDSLTYHYRHVSDEDYEAAKKELYA